MEKTISKFESRKTSMSLRGLFDKAHCAICYVNDEPSWITFTQESENESGKIVSNYVSLYKDDLKELFEMLKENEMI